MTVMPLTDPITLEIGPLPRIALDELYHFLQHLQLKYGTDLEPILEAIKDEIDSFDANVALQESGKIPSSSLKKELELQ